MITRKFLDPHICLQCRRSLAKRSVQLRSSKFLSERRRYSQEAFSNIDKNEDVDGENVEDPEVEEKYVTRKPDGTLRGHRGIFQREDLEELRGATSLGDQAKVIILRDSIFRKYVLEPEKPKIVKPQHIDILGTLAEERGLVGEDEVTRNINAFRPKEADSIQNWEELDKLTHTLERGFTVPQLERYLNDFRDKREIETPEIWKAKNAQSAITRITPWLPGISKDEQKFDMDPLREYYLTSHTPKQVLALRILRECWALELPELVEGIGQFEIRLRKGDLDLLLMGHNSILNSIHGTHLQFEEERLEAYRSRSTIRVTTTSAKKYAIVDAIQKAVQGIRRGYINMSALMPKHLGPIDKFMETYFDDATLEAIGQLTSTKISKVTFQNRHRLHLEVSCIESNPDAPSSLIDTVRRLLLNYDHSTSNIEQDLAVKQKGSSSGAMIDYTQIQGLSWRHKLQSWMRYTAPITKKLPEVEEPTVQPTLPTYIERVPKKRRNQPSEPKALDLEDEQLHWSQKYFTNTSALMGNILFSRPQILPLAPNSTPLNTPGLPQAFSTKVPNLSRVLSRAQLKNHRPIERLVLRFQPDPFVQGPLQPKSAKGLPLGIEGVSPFPNLEMTLSIDHKTKASTLIDVKAIVYEKRTNVMQPDNAVDIRFQQRVTSRLSRKFLKPIRMFLARSQLNLKAGEVDMAPSITLPMSQHLLRGKAPKVKKADQADKKVTADQADLKAPTDGETPSEEAGLKPPSTDDKTPPDQEIQYLYTGLEIHSTLNFYFRDFFLSYTSISAGKAGGQRYELKLRPQKSSSTIAREEDFIQTAYLLADMLGDGSGEHVNFDGVKSVEWDGKGSGRGAPRRRKLLFDYFKGGYKVNHGVGDMLTWGENEEVLDFGEEGEENAGGEEDLGAFMEKEELNDDGLQDFEEDVPWHHERES